MGKDNERKKVLRKIEKDAARPLRLLKELDPGSVLDDSPVELRSGEVVNDRDTGEIFLNLSFRTLSPTPLASLRVQIMLFREGLCIPYEKKELVYSWESGTLGTRVQNGKKRTAREQKTMRFLENGESFGDGVFVTLPDSYFVKLEVMLVSVTEENGTVRALRLKAGGGTNFSELSWELRDVYTRMNIFRDAEQVRPIRVLPKAGEHAWQCCCGRKNPSTTTLCEICGRDKQWQLSNLTIENMTRLQKEDERDTSRRILHDKTGFEPRSIETAEEIAEKERLCKEVLARVEVQQKEEEKKPTRIGIRILIALLGIAAFAGLLALVLRILQELGVQSIGETAGKAMLSQLLG